MTATETTLRRWRAATLWAVAVSGTLLIVVIAVLSTQTTPLEWWVMPLFATLPLSTLAVIITVTGSRLAQRRATVEALQGAADSLRELADEVEAVQRDRDRDR